MSTATRPQDTPQRSDVESAGSDQTTAKAHSGAGKDGQNQQYLPFWSPQLAGMRKEYFINMAKTTFAVSLIVWTGLALYWGSLYREYLNSPALHGWFINRDPNGVVGQNVSSFLQQLNNNGPLPRITWDFKDSAMYSDADIDYEVAVQQRPWAVLIVEQDITARLEAARAAGNASWNPNSAVTFVYSESRNQQAVDGIVLSATQQALNPVLSRISTTLAGQYLSANTGNAGAITAVAQAPQTLSGSIALGMRNLRPYATSNPHNGAILAATYVGLIYLTILSFNIVMANLNFRQGLQRKLKLSSLIGMRILVPIVVYFWLSLMVTLLQSAFHLDFNGWGLGYGAGFMSFWMIAWTAMSALGLMLEAILSLVGPPFIAFGLVFVIISNVSGALLPPELSGPFYKYSYGMIFYPVKTAFLVIFVNAGKHTDVAKQWSIVCGWLIVMLLTFPIWIWRERRSAEKAARLQHQHQQEQQSEKNEEGPKEH